jgi:hypothetical protein
MAGRPGPIDDRADHLVECRGRAVARGERGNARQPLSIEQTADDRVGERASGPQLVERGTRRRSECQLGRRKTEGTRHHEVQHAFGDGQVVGFDRVQHAFEGEPLPLGIHHLGRRVGVTAHYKQLIKVARGLGVIDARELDLDAYVTRMALDGLYLMIAQEEKRIRQDPVARTTELLKNVFG